MRHLLNTLYILTDDRYLALEGENIVLQEGERTAARFPLHTLEGIACFGYRGISPALMAACAERDISLCFYTPEGRFQARVCGEIRGNVLLRRQQFRTAEDPAAGCRIARSMLIGKVYNCRRILERALRDHELRLDAERVRAASAGLASSLEAIRGCTDPERRPAGISVYGANWFSTIRRCFDLMGDPGALPPIRPMPCCLLRIRCFPRTAFPLWRGQGWTPMWASCTGIVRGAPPWLWI